MENYLSLIRDRVGRTKTSNVLKAKEVFEDAMDEHEETSTKGWILDEEKRISQDMVNHIAKEVLLKGEMHPASMYEQLAERTKRFVRNERTGEPMWYSEEDYREWHKLLSERQRMMLPEELNESLDGITQTEITPKVLVALGFKEVYQGVDMGDPGYIYYTLDLMGMEFCSSSIGDVDTFHIMFGHEGQYYINDLRKLKSLINILKDL
tara:strand:- start:29 stop:652 length:624 start_codon:yes stop_codon:yes gene_type:complete